MSQGEFHFTLSERVDRNRETYLFGSIRMLNSVVFIRPAKREPGQPMRWNAVVKPYTGATFGGDNVPTDDDFEE